ncbi:MULTISPECIES: PadR family transcriptional regulator [Breznakia]|uniref:PadR family transcriptional regulator PadR n=1 Tax=Breznakia blatticola TaxID=1754012 RepID=A0A4R8A3S0_9FIRM|nr:MULTISPECIES: PadR family transcriptional regulator [Breznakia]MDH6366187.1 PadR family transcriptional regulator PadR [Breznakia sp. PH1-1]MDH6403280.1 PadR family transcriptional regulator PadR [Breznakia sp. PF1-11]MDH6410989.1 PadR family transcriptional regulator PadR [Breznakia sp. PFB1-11]MDH6413353.1 PadR family transcriptional regulator PadR [Breznakia sp. PFB1-14]MDH6416118.1 PadR family transcriptional regulator PadR [Breznakia sp. PFB1-4]
MKFQLGSSLLDACVLSILRNDDAYGYKLTQEVKTVIEVSESTLYPVLRRLTKDGYLETYDKQFEGRNRRYYTLTEQGKKQYQLYYDAWKEFSTRISNIMEGGHTNGEYD